MVVLNDGTGLGLTVPYFGFDWNFDDLSPKLGMRPGLQLFDPVKVDGNFV